VSNISGGESRTRVDYEPRTIPAGIFYPAPTAQAHDVKERDFKPHRSFVRSLKPMRHTPGEVEMTGAVSHFNSRAVQVIIGVDTHKDQHVAVTIGGRGIRLGERHVPVATSGYEELERWSCDLGQIHAFGIEGTGSYGAGLARFLTDRSHAVIEINRPDRSVRYRKGKSDPTDAEMAARSVLAGIADAIPKSGEGEVEMIRMLKSAKNSAVMARTQAVNQMKALVVTAPAELRERLDGLATGALAERCRNFRPGRLDSPKAAAKYTLRSLACRYRQLS